MSEIKDSEKVLTYKTGGNAAEDDGRFKNDSKDFNNKYLLKDSRSVVFSGLTGGCGCSFIVNSISSYLAGTRSKNILLLDLQAGKKDSRIVFKISGDTIRDLGDIGCDFCEMDLSALRKLVINLDSSLNIILPSLKFEKVQSRIRENIPGLIEILSCYFDLVIVDLPYYLFFDSGSLAERFDKIILVSQADEISISNLDNYIYNLSAENSLSKFEIAINKFNLKTVLSPARITNAVRFPVRTFIPYDRDIEYLYRSRGPMAVFDYSLRIVKSLKDFADMLYDDLGF